MKKLMQIVNLKISTTFALSLVLFVSLFVGSALVYAATSYSVSMTQTSLIDEWQICRNVTNNSPVGLSLFVPTATQAEWTSIHTHTPTGVSLAACTGGNCHGYDARATCGTQTLTWAPNCSAPAVAKAQADAEWTAAGISQADLAAGKAAIDAAQSSFGTVNLCGQANSVEEFSGTYQGWAWTSIREFECSNAPDNQGPVYTIEVSKSICY